MCEYKSLCASALGKKYHSRNKQINKINFVLYFTVGTTLKIIKKYYKTLKWQKQTEKLTFLLVLDGKLLFHLMTWKSRKEHFWKDLQYLFIINPFTREAVAWKVTIIQLKTHNKNSVNSYRVWWHNKILTVTFFKKERKKSALIETVMLIKML